MYFNVILLGLFHISMLNMCFGLLSPFQETNDYLVCARCSTLNFFSKQLFHYKLFKFAFIVRTRNELIEIILV